MDFNANDFIHQSIETELDTVVVPVPLGEWQMQLGKPTPRQVTIKKGERAGELMTFLDLSCEILDPEVKEELKRDKVMTRYSIILDLDDNNDLDTSEGKNVDLGRLLEACQLNGKGATLAEVEGQVVIGKIKHRADDDDPETVYSEVSKVRADS